MLKAPTACSRTIIGAAAILLLVALLTGAPAVASAAKPTSGKAKRPAKPHIALSAQPAQLELHPCLWTTLEVGMTNEGDEPVYAAVTVTPERPLTPVSGAPGATPTTSLVLSLAATVPATCVPCPLKSVFLPPAKLTCPTRLRSECFAIRESIT